MKSVACFIGWKVGTCNATQLKISGSDYIHRKYQTSNLTFVQQIHSMHLCRKLTSNKQGRFELGLVKLG